MFKGMIRKATKHQTTHLVLCTAILVFNVLEFSTGALGRDGPCALKQNLGQTNAVVIVGRVLHISSECSW